MSLPRIRLMEIISSVVWASIFVIGVVYIGSKYSMQEGPLQEGTLWMIGIITAFIIAMMGTGYWLSTIEE
tara:strand:+ start:27895 stop:28104 length:210 start_codon:yes stop_codon:yes gene_type:complete